MPEIRDKYLMKYMEDELYKEEVRCWLVNHSAIYLFFWGLSISREALFRMPFEFYGWIRAQIKGDDNG